MANEPAPSPLLDSSHRIAGTFEPPFTRLTAGALTALSRGYFPELLGIENLVVESRRVLARVAVRRELMAPHGYLHGGTLVSVADTLCG